jgi:hypothetical protein
VRKRKQKRKKSFERSLPERCLTATKISRVRFNGPVDVDEVGMFGIRARISPIAFAGANLVLAGDAVGEGHWSVGGGMHVAGMFHQTLG